MATLKQRMHRKNSAGGYDIVHLETEWDLITGKPSTFPPSSHTHSEYFNKSGAGDFITPNDDAAVGFVGYKTTTRNGRFIQLHAGDKNGSAVVMGDGGLTIVGGGEAAQSLYTALTTAAASPKSPGTEELHLCSDTDLYIHVNCNSIANRKTFKFNKNGSVTFPDGTAGGWVGMQQVTGQATSPYRPTFNPIGKAAKYIFFYCYRGTVYGLAHMVWILLDGSYRNVTDEWGGTANGGSGSYTVSEDASRYAQAYVDINGDETYSVFYGWSHNPVTPELLMSHKWQAPYRTNYYHQSLNWVMMYG